MPFAGSEPLFMQSDVSGCGNASGRAPRSPVWTRPSPRSRLTAAADPACAQAATGYRLVADRVLLHCRNDTPPRHYPRYVVRHGIAERCDQLCPQRRCSTGSDHGLGRIPLAESGVDADDMAPKRTCRAEPPTAHPNRVVRIELIGRFPGPTQPCQSTTSRLLAGHLPRPKVRMSRSEPAPGP